jgi:uncharacterized protein (DUF2062 family)
VTAPLRAVWDFVVGDDWMLALGAALALAVTAALAAAGLAAWWVAPLLVPAVLAASVRRGLGARRRVGADGEQVYKVQQR